MNARLSVLFLCNHNSARSQMAEAFLRARAGERFQVFSAGIGSKDIKPMVFEVMEEIGVSLEGHHSKTVEDVLDHAPFDFAIIVCKADEDECPHLHRIAQTTLRWSIESPFEGTSPRDLSGPEKRVHYRSLRDQLEQRIQEWLRAGLAAG